MLHLVHGTVLIILVQWNQAGNELETPVLYLLYSGPLIFFLYIYLFIYLFIFGCIGSSLLCVGFF